MLASWSLRKELLSISRAIEGVRQDRLPLFVIEESLIGVSHAEVGAYLLSLWGLPSPVVEAVAHHHHPERVRHDKLEMISAVYLANLLAHEHFGDKNDPMDTAQPIRGGILAIPGVAAKLPEWHEMAEAAAQEPQGMRDA